MNGPIEVIVDQYWLTLIVGVVLPAIVALVTKRLASGGVKAITLLFLSVLAGWLTQVIQDDGHFELKATIANILLSFGTAVVAHYGLLQPIKVTGKQGAIQSAVPGGIGTEGNAQI